MTTGGKCPHRHIQIVVFVLLYRRILICRIHRSPRWSSGCPRMLLLMLLAFVLEFDSHRGEILNELAKNKRKKKVNC